jgi:non-heme chloroperoxidase
MPHVSSADGVSIFYRVVGNGPTDVLLLHGWAGSGAYFDDLIPLLDARKSRIITMDIRGHGESQRPLAGYDLSSVTNDVIAVADAVGAAEFVLVGFSMSGKFAQFVACERPDRVKGLVLVAGSPASEIPFPLDMQRDWVSRAGTRARLDQLMHLFLVQPIASDIRLRLDRFLDVAVNVPAMALDETLTMAARTAFAERVATLNMPILAVAARQDALFGPDTVTAWLHRELPRARCAFVDCNHEIPIERPHELAGLIEAFLAGMNA